MPFNLSDFLSNAGNVYAQVKTADATVDAAKLNQQAAATTAVAQAQNQLISAQTKTYLVYGFLILLGILAVGFAVKMFRK